VSDRGETITAVMPVHDAASLVGDAVAAFLPALESTGGRLLVVDDASSDGTGDLAAAAGAEVLRLDTASGPYVARNAGWRHAAADLLVFVDVRCRPTPTWPGSLFAAFDDPDVALAAGDVRVRTGPTVAARAAAELQPLSSSHGKQHAFLPYAPTCHLAARRSVLEHLDGFRPVRGGGDVDLCWRAQLEGCGRLEFVDDAVLEWVPRERLRDLLSQFRRYGANQARLDREFAPFGRDAPAAPHPARVAIHELRMLGRTRPPQVDPVSHDDAARPGWAERAVAGAARVAMAAGTHRGATETAGPTPP
jgi:glycosyltransferase involved in cell wall biosynthesis